MTSIPCLLMQGIRNISTAQIELPRPKADEVLIATLYSGVSPGTELRCYNGTQDNLPSEPFVSGYALVGRVIETGSASTRLCQGDLVFSPGSSNFTGAVSKWGGHVGGAVVAEANVFKLPDGVDPLVAVLAKLGAIAYHGLRWSQPLPDEKVVVIGLGPLGLLSALLHRLTGAEVLALDRVPARADLARTLGLESVASTNSAADLVQDYFGSGADVVVDCTGVSAALSDSIDCLESHPWNVPRIRPQRLLVQGSYATVFSADYHTAFMKEATLRFARDNDSTDVTSVLRLMARGLLKPRAIISRVAELDEAQNLYHELESKNDLVTAAFRWAD